MPTKSMSRRDFLRVTGVTLGALAAISGLGYAVTCVAGGSDAGAESETEPETPTFHYGDENTMNKRILVTYATRTGSTVGVAAAIGETLSSRGFAVDVKPVHTNPPVEGYDIVVMGSAVNGGQWLPEAVQFVRRNRQALNRVPVTLFTVHAMNIGDDAKSRQKRLAYLDEIRPLLKPVDEVYFAGIGIDPKKSSWLERWAYKSLGGGGAEGDCRDWARIRGWAQTTRV